MSKFFTEEDNEAMIAAQAEARARAEAEVSAKAEREQAERRRVEAVARLAYLRPISAQPALNAAHKVRLDEEAGRLYVDGVDVSSYVEVKQTYRSGSSWRSMGRPTGKSVMSIGDYGQRVTYPERKDGSFNWEAAAQGLAHVAVRINAAHRADAMRRANAAIVEHVAKAVGDDRWAGFKVDASTHSEGRVSIHIDVKKSMTEEGALALHALLKKEGVL